MDDPEATPPHFSLSKQGASDSISYPTINKQRKSSESKLKLTQIGDMSPDPDFRTELVAYDGSKESRSSRRKRAMIDDLYDHTKVHSPVIERAEELRANLEASLPSFWKAMVKSNVTHGFWLHLPMRFCKLHMPKNDTVFTLENENGGEYKVNYISQRTALSGGWKAFCDSNELNEADVLVFHLIGPLKFKVFVVRANGIANVNAEAKPLNSVPLDVEFEATIKDQTEKGKRSKKRAKRLKSPPGFIQDNIQNNGLMVLETTNGHVTDQFENGSADLGPNSSEGLQSSESTCNFKEVRSIDDFTILVNDLAIDSELSDHHRTKYYELCCSQNSFLHNHLLKSINCKLAAEIITQTVNIAEAIRACNLSTSQADYEVWDKTLKGFELLGMNVAFLRARLNRLMSLALELEEPMESKRLKEVTLEKSRAEEEIRALELKLLTLKETTGILDYKVESLKAKAEKHALKFQEEVNAPW
ncbi:B3 domain-containing protein Os01g0234100-like isoform X1 [Pistacia vera]|uniref:B3 domain-containing protein Os01g0234100-like isoform X1 n=1 Tax=Pistacia vera TaxID=55513 RepID=UPI001263E19E|nr:B3 domain-containing protein Os01g0234100-like isoform X1 [Pistacia vera]